MAIDLRKLLTPEQRERWDKWNAYKEEQRQRFSAMDNDTLVNSAKYFMTQMQSCREYPPGLPVYDASFYHAIVPEILKRLQEIDNE